MAQLSGARRWRRQRSEQGECMRRVEEHFQPLFNDLTPIDKRFAMGLLHATGGITKLLEEINDVVLSPNTLGALANASKFVAELSAQPIGRMFYIRESIPEAIFEQKEDGAYVVSKRAQRVLPALVDFLASNRLSEDLMEAFPPWPSHFPAELRRRFYPRYRRGRRMERVDWRSIGFETQNVEQEK